MNHSRSMQPKAGAHSEQNVGSRFGVTARVAGILLLLCLRTDAVQPDPRQVELRRK